MKLAALTMLAKCLGQSLRQRLARVGVLTLVLLATMSYVLADPANDVIPTNSRIHKLEIAYKPEQRKDIQRVELVASTDKGGVWKVIDAVTPDKDHLLLKAPADGTYWVKMVIVFRDGRREPEDVMRMQPDFKMLIDATLPVVRVNAARVGDDVVADWTIDEQNPNEQATQVVYRGIGPAGGEWQPVPASSIIRRTAKFKPNISGPIVVQVVAQDQVGNQGIGAKEVAAGATTSTTANYPPSPTINPMKPVGGLEAPIGGPTPPGPIPPPVLDPVPNPAPPAGNTAAGPVPPPVAGAGPIVPPPVATPTAPVPAPGPTAPTPLPTGPAPGLGPVAPLPGAGPTPAPFPAPGPTPAPPVAGNPLQVQPAGNTSPVPLPVTNANDVRNNPNWNTPSGMTPAPEPVSTAPASQAINFLKFDLQYQIDNGPSGISRVDLYVTRDEGRSWVKWSEHDGRQMPLKVALDMAFNQQREGEYGFRLVPVSGAGLSDGAPVSGTVPELRVHVDLTPPLIRPFMPTADANQRNTLTLLWEASDKNFGTNPIAIEWAESPSGPWKPVNAAEPAPSVGMPLPVSGQAPAITPTAQRLPNTGSYAWQLPANMNTHKVYLKFAAWDAAGNKSEVITQSPVMVDLVKPRARIQGIMSPLAPTRP